MPQTKAFRVGYAIALILLIILLAYKVKFIFQPIVVLVQTLFFPFLVAGILYYLFRPIVYWLEKWKIPRTISILLIYLVFIGAFVLIGFLVGPPLKEQVEKLAKEMPHMIEISKEKAIELSNQPWISQQMNDIKWDEIIAPLTEYLKNGLLRIGTNLASFFKVITNILVVFVTVPFILYYMLKEGEQFPSYLLRLLPEEERKRGLRVLSEMDHALSTYIKGQILVSVFVGVLVYIGYLIIGIEYSLILALVAMFTNVIPYIGPILSVIPAVVVAFIDSPFMVVKVLIVAVIAQQLEGNLVSPMVMGKNLNIHPLTIIVLLLVAGSIGGFLGLLLAVPTYAVAKVVISHFYRFYLLRINKESLRKDSAT